MGDPAGVVLTVSDPGERSPQVADAAPVADLDAVMRRIALGDESAFAELYDRLVPSVHRLAQLVLGRCEEADAVVRETFVEVWRRAVDPRLTAGLRIDAWILVTAHRIASTLDGPRPPPIELRPRTGDAPDAAVLGG